MNERKRGRVRPGEIGSKGGRFGLAPALSADDLGPSLRHRARTALRAHLGAEADLDRPEVVAQASYDALRTAWGCGQVTMREIRHWLRERGVDLSGAPGLTEEAERTMAARVARVYLEAAGGDAERACQELAYVSLRAAWATGGARMLRWVESRLLEEIGE
jgi:hypothetical protein